MSVLIEYFFDKIIVLVTSLGYWGIGLGMMLESACMPVPSEIVLPLGGYLAYLGKITFVEALISGILGSLVGSILAYMVGYYGGRPFILKYGKYFLINANDFEKADKWFNKHGELTVFTSRLLPIIRTFISLPAGIARIDFKKFVLYTMLGIIPWSLALTYAGFILGKNWMFVKSSLKGFDSIIIFLLVIVVIIYIIRHLHKKNNL